MATLALVALRHIPDDPPLSGLEGTLIDLRFAARGPRQPPDSILIVSIDDTDVAEIGMMGPMRRALAEALPRLATEGALAIVIDLLLSDPTPADAELADALALVSGAVLAVAVTPGSAAPRPPPIEAVLRANAFPVVMGYRSERESATAAAQSPRLLMPTVELAEAAALGHVNIALSPDRIARRAPLAIALGDGAFLPAIAVVAAHRMLAGELVLRPGDSVALGDRVVATDAAGQVLVNHYGGPGTLHTVSLGALLAGEVAPDLIEGRAVFIGAGAESLRDIFATPFGPDVLGVEVLATLAANLIDGSLIRSGGALWVAALVLALAAVVLAGMAAAVPNSPLLAALATFAVWGMAAGALQAAFNAGVALDATSVLGAVGIASLAHWLGRLRSDEIGAQRLEAERGMLSRFLSPFANRTLPKQGVTPVWRTEEATIGFVDLEGSVGLAEGQSPDETAALLSDIQGLIAGAAARHGGAVVERFGDGALVAFGFGGGTAADAIAFARDLVAAPTGDRRLRISLHCGPVALADIGGEGWGHVTVAGDTVNVAARLQDTAKRARATVVVGRSVLEAAGVDLTASPAAFRPLAMESVRGRSKPVEVWAML
ncbi:MAG TPA: adenylate/guanylate cyclase domain-containing protein [Aestuariivirgaceae bacterium]|nr:adenylate/guanylate cyclase domain-containing protein [Aestuariivirgaceae bacterium]